MSDYLLLLFRATLLSISFSLSVTAFAAPAPFKVKGNLEDAEGEPCIGATFRIFAAGDTVKPVIMNVTGSDGEFNSTLSRPGTYILKAQYLGMKDISRRFSVSTAEPEADLKTLIMEKSNADLQEVVITGVRKLVESDGATLSYNVQEDPESATNSVLEMLRKVPMVTVDAEDNIKVNGSSNFKLLMNGKEDPMLAGDPQIVLKSMPAASIKKIEVITEPGAKYEAEGVGGVLNIITETGSRIDGYFANLSARYSSRNAGVSAYARTKIKNVTLNANVDYNNGRILQPHAYSERSVENLTDDSRRWQLTDSKMKSGWDYTGARFNMSWEPDTLNLFTVGANIGDNGYGINSIQSIRMLNSDLEKVWSLGRDNDSDGKNFSTGVKASYQHTFGKQGRHLIISYNYGYGNNSNDAVTNSYDIVNYPLDYIYRKQESKGHSNDHVMQIDYSNPFSEKHLFEAGSKGNFQRNTSEDLPFYGNSENDLHLNEIERMKLTQFKDIFALYTSYTGNYGKWNVKAGLRWEYTHMGIDYKVAGYDNFVSILNDLVPNGAVSYKFADAANLRLAYQMRISRPGVWNLNPFRNTMTEEQVQYGNPDLKSGKSHNISLAYSNYGGIFGGTVKFNYRQVDNGVIDIIFMRDNILNSTYANVGKERGYTLEANLTMQAIRNLTVSLWARGGYEIYKAHSELLDQKAEGWTWGGNLNADYRFPNKYRLSVFGGVWSPWIDLQSKGKTQYYYGLSASKSFLKDDALTISVFGNNFIPPTFKGGWTQVSETAVIKSNSTLKRWSAGIGVTFRFGGLKTDVKQTDADVESDSSGSGAGNKG